MDKNKYRNITTVKNNNFRRLLIDIIVHKMTICYKVFMFVFYHEHYKRCRETYYLIIKKENSYLQKWPVRQNLQINQTWLKSSDKELLLMFVTYFCITCKVDNETQKTAKIMNSKSSTNKTTMIFFYSWLWIRI